jgi:hypothetical protein
MMKCREHGAHEICGWHSTPCDAMPEIRPNMLGHAANPEVTVAARLALAEELLRAALIDLTNGPDTHTVEDQTRAAVRAVVVARERLAGR